MGLIPSSSVHVYHFSGLEKIRSAANRSTFGEDASRNSEGDDGSVYSSMPSLHSRGLDASSSSSSSSSYHGTPMEPRISSAPESQESDSVPSLDYRYDSSDDGSSVKDGSIRSFILPLHSKSIDASSSSSDSVPSLDYRYDSSDDDSSVNDGNVRPSRPSLHSRCKDDSSSFSSPYPDSDNDSSGCITQVQISNPSFSSPVRLRGGGTESSATTSSPKDNSGNTSTSSKSSFKHSSINPLFLSKKSNDPIRNTSSPVPFDSQFKSRDPSNLMAPKNPWINTRKTEDQIFPPKSTDQFHPNLLGLQDLTISPSVEEQDDLTGEFTAGRSRINSSGASSTPQSKNPAPYGDCSNTVNPSDSTVTPILMQNSNLLHALAESNSENDLLLPSELRQSIQESLSLNKTLGNLDPVEMLRLLEEGQADQASPTTIQTIEKLIEDRTRVIRDFKTLLCEKAEMRPNRTKQHDPPSKRNVSQTSQPVSQHPKPAKRPKSESIRSRKSSSARPRPTPKPPRTERETKKIARANKQCITPNAELKKKYNNFQLGSASFRQKLQVSPEEVIRSIGKSTEPNETFKVVSETLSATARLEASVTEINEIKKTTELLKDGGVGYIPSTKKSDRVRICHENVNSLGIGTKTWKLDKLNGSILQGLEVDVFTCCEIQCDWRFVPQDKQWRKIIRPGVEVKGQAANNTAGKKISRDQVGGTAVAAIGRICDVVQEVGKDDKNLGRWSWIKLTGDTGVTTYIVSAYYPRKSSSGGKRTAWFQHKSEYEGLGDMRPHSVIYEEDLLKLIKPWREGGANVVLCMDVNQNVYSGKLAQKLMKAPYSLSCLVQECTGDSTPPSWFRGSEPICTIFGTPGLCVENAIVFPHHYGVGDHRITLIEISAASLFGGSYPKMPKKSARQLNCSIERTKRQYCAALSKLLEEHNMYEKLNLLWTMDLDEETLTSTHEAFDTELGELMAAAESQCTKYKRDDLECSPEVNILIKRRQVLKWILRYIDGKVPHPARLLRAASVHNIVNALELTREEVVAKLERCTADLAEIREQAPSLRRKFLHLRLREAKEAEDIRESQEIEEIIRRESEKDRQRRINKVVRAPRGRAVLKVQLNDPKITPSTEADYRTTEREIVQEVNSRLGERFQLGKRAPSSSGALKEALGDLAMSPASQEILDGTFQFPDDCDHATKLLLEEVHHIYSSLENSEQDSGQLSIDDYTGYWKTMDERTSSSYSGRHLGHYKASIDNQDISALQASNVNLSLSRGVPLSRWKKGVTVLLEKEPGNCFIEKLRAICLLEADLNMVLRTFYARRMMYRMKEGNMIPVEQIATKGKTALDGVMHKQFFYDTANITHVDCSLSSTDAANCYDAVNHPVCSLALQSMHVSILAILTYLHCLRTMTFFLKTGFGMAKEGYGGTEAVPYMGLTQGSCVSPPVWVAVSTLIVCAYRREGHGVTYTTAWSNLVLVIAAILFVDDTDLLHRRKKEHLTLEEFLAYLQQATYLWALLLQATGGNLKPAKCYYYLLIYKFENGEARLCNLRELQDLPRIRIPQPSAEDVEITLKACDDPSETLGVFTCPKDDGTAQLDKMMAKAYKWSDNIRSSNLCSRDVWQSFNTQARASAGYGLAALMTGPAVVEETFLRWYYEFLPSLGVNRNIATDWRWIPRQYNGLGLDNMGIEKCSEMISFFARHWEMGTSMSIQIRHASELVQVETGLRGNFLVRDFGNLGRLASVSWMKLLWEYLDYYRITLEVDGMEIPPIRERDEPLMELVIKKCAQDQWTAINKVRKFKKVYFVSQMVAGNGTTILPDIINDESGRDTTMEFPREQPTSADLTIWRDALRTIFSPYLILPVPIGKYLRPPPYTEIFWAETNTPSRLIKETTGSDEYEVYLVDDNIRPTRSSKVWKYSHSVPQPPTKRYCTSIKFLDRYSVSSFSSAQMLSNDDNHTRWKSESLYTRLCSFSHPTLWTYLEPREDVTWVEEAILNGTFLSVHDGSYMPNKALDVCSAALVFTCTKTRKIGYVSISEKTDQYTANNYRGEVLGGILNTCIIKAAEMGMDAPKGKVTSGCDNKGVLAHSKDPYRPMSDKQPQADALRSFRNTLRELSTEVSYVHVFAHQDDNADFAELALISQLNVIADDLAKDRLLKSLSYEFFIKSIFPNEHFRVHLDKKKIFTSTKHNLYTTWGRKVAKELHISKGTLDKDGFELVNWDAVGQASKKMTPSYLAWMCKLSSHFLSTNRMMSKIEIGATNLCPCCGRIEETTKHLTLCEDEGRTQMYHQSVDIFQEWMIDNDMETSLREAIGEYLLFRGKKKLSKILEHEDDDLLTYAREHDKLGWQNFLEGRVSTSLFVIQEEWLREIGSSRTITTWSGQFVTRLIEITHRQWVYRNAKIHLRKTEGMTKDEHIKVMEEVKEMMLTDPQLLLPQHQHLLEEDFLKLGAGTTVDRLVWLDQMEKAVRAKRAIQGRTDDIDDFVYNDDKRHRPANTSPYNKAPRGSSEPPQCPKRTTQVPSKARKARSTAPSRLKGGESREDGGLSQTLDNVCHRRSGLRLRSEIG